ncbi:DoxX family protein [Mycolicibacterium flavescens]|uniref:DoxX family protein n=1 Tax=Mycolicibacterium flavescens TaxID=1776 RepID=A0A1E3RNS2_MYCFV|nr:DoxX family protein [Mycolicibacterium flavescens]MCV7281456.1 DoxX family protein [Mycolicibacterium flavescens]ODQ91047.1 DoxX family protein [Mycolicibacterium flavescens]
MTTFDARLASYSSPLLSLFRIIAGLMFALHGSMKLFGWPIGEAVPVGTWPFWWAGIIELVGGLLITVGLFTRIAAFIASGEMAVAYFWMHWPPLDGPPASFWPMENGGEVVLLYCFGFLAIAALGAGAWSVDARRRGGMGRSAPGRVVSGTAAPAGYATGAPVRRGGLFNRFRR